ncbi:chorismate mutase, partial [Staphylococcus aureus]
VQTDTKQEDIQHVYLEEAVTLRPDLQLTKNKEL